MLEPLKYGIGELKKPPHNPNVNYSYHWETNPVVPKGAQDDQRPVQKLVYLTSISGT